MTNKEVNTPVPPLVACTKKEKVPNYARNKNLEFVVLKNKTTRPWVNRNSTPAAAVVYTLNTRQVSEFEHELP